MKNAALSFIFDAPITINDFSFFDVHSGKSYINWEASEINFKKAYKTHIKDQLKDIITLCKDEKPISVFFSGYFLELLKNHDLQTVSEIQEAVKSGNLELLGGTYNYSLSSVYAPTQFIFEVKLHLKQTKEILGYVPKRFYNPENIFFNGLCEKLTALGFKSTFAGAIEWYLGDARNERVTLSKNSNKFKVLLLDTDQGKALFDDKNRNIHFLSFDQDMLKSQGGVKNIVRHAQKAADIKSLSEILNSSKPTIVYNIKTPVMGSIHSRSLTDYNGQAMQENIIRQYYGLSEKVLTSKKQVLTKDYLALGKADLFRSLSIDSDQEKHTPYHKYSQLINILSDIEIRVS